MKNGKTVNTRILNRFQYHVEDCDCKFCLYSKGPKRGCSLTACCCEDIRNEALANGHISRKPVVMR